MTDRTLYRIRQMFRYQERHRESAWQEWNVPDDVVPVFAVSETLNAYAAADQFILGLSNDPMFNRPGERRIVAWDDFSPKEVA